MQEENWLVNNPEKVKVGEGRRRKRRGE